MSDTILRYVPSDPFWQPTERDANNAVSLLKSMVREPGATVEARFEANIRFYDPGQNWSGVECVACGADAEGWWGDGMDAAYADEFRNLDVVAPCCGATVSLNNLKYIWPAAFGRFCLEARHPDIPDTTDDEDRQLACCIGNPLRKIWVRV